MKSYVKPVLKITELRAEEGIACFGSTDNSHEDQHGGNNNHHGKPGKNKGGKKGGWDWGSFFPW